MASALHEGGGAAATKGADGMQRAGIGRGNFTKIKLLGKGNVGNVYMVHSSGLERNGIFAMKVLKKSDMIERQKVRRVLTEKEILATANHPFIVTLHYSFQTRDKLYFVMQYCAGGELFTALRSRAGKRFEESTARFYAAEILLAIEYLHALGFIYRDLKPENVLLHASGHAILADFDLSRIAVGAAPAVPMEMKRRRRGFWRSLLPFGRRSNDGRPQKMEKRKRRGGGSPKRGDKPVIDFETAIKIERTASFVGTDHYMSPEMILGKEYGGSIDWWSYGVLLFELLYGTTPFKGADRVDLFAAIADADEKIVFPTSDQIKVSGAFKTLIRGLLHKQSSKRLKSPAYIKNATWFRGKVKWALLRHQTPPIVPQLDHVLDTRNFPQTAPGSSKLMSMSTDEPPTRKKKTKKTADGAPIAEKDGDDAKEEDGDEDEDEPSFGEFNFERTIDPHWSLRFSSPPPERPSIPTDWKEKK